MFQIDLFPKEFTGTRSMRSSLQYSDGRIFSIIYILQSTIKQY